jgi:hypothetical protein
MGEGEERVSLLDRLVDHVNNTARYNIWYGEGRDAYDVAGRTAHESIFSTNNGEYRCPSTHQGYSPFSTWTRGLAWAMLGYAEQLEFFATIPDAKFKESVGMNKRDVMRVYEQAATETCEHYIEDVSALDGITYWDDGAPQLHHLDWQAEPADPYNEYEPVDSSASAIAAQGLIRLGKHL